MHVQRGVAIIKIYFKNCMHSDVINGLVKFEEGSDFRKATKTENQLI